MKKITLTNPTQKNTTVLENEFIDRYMAKANGEYVKVYLLLLRQLNTSAHALSVSQIADFLDLTERDVIRALNYWKQEALLDYDLAEAQQDYHTSGYQYPETDAPADSGIPDIGFAKPAAGNPRDPVAFITPAADVPSIKQFRSRKEFKELVFVAEQYLGKTLSSTEIDAVTYFYETLQMSTDLIEYLIEYCVENGHKSIHYIQKVALSWHEQGIITVEQAKASTLLYNKNCYSILNAYGIKGRAPAACELAFIRKWNEEYGFSLDLILEACMRTMNAIHQPSFEYTDSILNNWYQHHIHSLAEISSLDADYLREKERKNKQTAKSAQKTGTKFNNFDSRSYDMSDLERRLVQQ